MPLMIKVRRFLATLLSQLNTFHILLLLAIYIATSWLSLWLAGETDLVKNLQAFLYWLVVTGSTVGYGDLSPSTQPGQLITAFWVIPAGLTLFAAVLTQLGNTMLAAFKKNRLGMTQLNLNNHIVIIGWKADKTLKLLDLILYETNNRRQPLVLCVDEPIENPKPGAIEFVAVTSYHNAQEMARACLETAKIIIIDTEQDDVTLTTALFCHQVNPSCHKIAYFKEESVGQLLKSHCPDIECTPSVATEMLAKAALDPGSSHLHHQLLDVTVGMTQYSELFQGSHSELKVEDLFLRLKTEANATLIGIQLPDSPQVTINPKAITAISPGSRIFYIADERLNHQEIFGV